MARPGALPVLALLLVVAVLAAAPPAAEAITCGEVVTLLRPCIPYVRRQVSQLPAGCCSGVKTLNGRAQTTPDRQAACTCLKTNVATIKGIDFGIAQRVPGMCGVSVPYPISTTVDCSKVK